MDAIVPANDGFGIQVTDAGRGLLMLPCRVMARGPAARVSVPSSAEWFVPTMARAPKVS
jgi:hypothetical protein